MNECDLVCQKFESVAVFTRVGNIWQTDIEEAVCDEEEPDACFDNLDEIPAGTLVTIGLDNDINVPVPEWEWVARISADIVECPIITTDCCGNSYVVGHSLFDDVRFYNSSSNIPAITRLNINVKDVFVGKINTFGEWQWAVRLGGHGTDEVPYICTDNYGNLFVVGEYDETITFYDIDDNPTSFSLVQGSNKDIFVSKIDMDGNWRWVARASGSAQDFMPQVDTDTCGNAYVSGEFQGITMTFHNRDDSISTTLTQLNDDDLFLAKISPDGQWIWAAQASANFNSLNASVSVDCFDNIWFIGGYNGTTVTFLNGDGSVGLEVLREGDNRDVYVSRITSDGIWEWVAQVGGQSQNEVSQFVATDCCGFGYVSGDYRSTLITFYNSDGAANQQLVNNTSNTYIFLGKLGTEGSWRWVLRINNAFDMSIVIDRQGNIYVSGHYGFDDPIFFNSDGTDSGSSILGTNGNSNVFLGKINTDGFWQWVTRIGSTDVARNPNLSVDCCRNIFAVGSYTSDVTFYNLDGLTSVSLTESNFEDIYVAKMHNSVCFPGIVQDDGCVNFKGIINVTDATFDPNDYPIINGAKYYYDEVNNVLTTTCTSKKCGKCCCLDCQLLLNSTDTVFGIGMPQNKICVL